MRKAVCAEHVENFEYRIRVFKIVLREDGNLMWVYAQPPEEHPVPDIRAYGYTSNAFEGERIIEKYAKLIGADWIKYLYHTSRDHIPKLSDTEMLALLGEKDGSV